ncbi:MAG: hypothetical protein PHP10_00950 [Candidatus Omnitrophica bacterium]|nr:hypothetical protein [Candidatus Omnitrophota bacterium]
MMGNQWIESFLESLFERKDESNLDVYNEKDSKWTKFMVENVIKKGMEEKTNCHVVCITSNDSAIKQESGEYLNIDAMFFNTSDYQKQVYLKVNNKIDFDPWVLPAVIVEHENAGSGKEKIAYCLWKLLCIRSQLRVLICYWDSVDGIREFLENTIIEGGLAEGLIGELLIIIGDRLKDKVLWHDRADINNYFSIFQWKNNRLDKFSVS